MKHLIAFTLLIAFLFSCKENKEERMNTHRLTVKQAKGYVVSPDSVKPVADILAGPEIVTKASAPQVIPANINIKPVLKPLSNIIPKLIKCTPGTDSFAKPEIISVHDTLIPCINPETTVAKDATSKDQNPENFSTYSKLQGLKHVQVRCLYRDKKGHLWFGSEGGGVCCYNGKTFTHFLDKDGLAGNIVYSILESKDQKFWFGTHQGICSYNGKEFKRYSDDKGLTSSLAFAAKEDAAGNIWFSSTAGGVGCFNGKTITHYTYKQGLCKGVINCIFIDNTGRIWFGSDNDGVCYFDGKSFTRVISKETVSSYSVRNIYQDKQGYIWITTEGSGFNFFDGKTFTNFSLAQGLTNSFIFSMCEEEDGTLWFGTNGGGLIKYDRHGNNKSAWNENATFTSYTTEQGLSGNIVNTVLQDSQGKLWLGMGGAGLSRYDGKTFTHFTDKEGLATHLNFSMYEDSKRQIWLGTFAGITAYNGKTFTHYSPQNGLSGSLINAIYEDTDGKLWFGSYGGGACSFDGVSFRSYTKKNNFPNNFVWSIIRDNKNQMWFGTFGGGVVCSNNGHYKNYTTNEGLSNNYIYFIVEDKQGNVWIGTNGGGVNKFDGKTFTHFTEKEGMPNNAVYSGFVDKDGGIWFGTGGGVCFYNGKTFKHLTEKEGLSNNSVMSIIQDKKGNMWFGTRNGLSKLSYNHFKKITSPSYNDVLSEDEVLFKNYNYEDGYLCIGSFRMAMHEDSEGNIWIGGNDRLTVFHPEVQSTDTTKPQIELTGLQLYNEPVSWAALQDNGRIKDTSLMLGNGVTVKDFSFSSLSDIYSVPGNLSLPYNNNYLTFNFAGISLSQSKKLKYLYKMEGLEDNWSALTSRSEAPYGNIPPGKYTFKVKVMSPEGVWSNELDYPFSIRPPWWQTIAFRITAFLIIIGLIILYIKWRERSLKERQIILEKTVDERTSELQEEKKLLEQQRAITEEQKHVIEEKHKEITDSINYAERIQRALLANKETLNNHLNDYFILFKPKDIVSGDFYWANSPSNKLFYLAVCDSTGHGVPGAIMSILNMSCLDKAMSQGITNPDGILNETRRLVIESLKNDGSEGGGKDGMDGALIQLDFETMTLKGACANNPVWVIRNGALIEIKADRIPIGRHERDNIPFTLHTFSLQKNDTVYLLTDGFADQFGGEKGKKFKYKRIQEVLLAVKDQPMKAQLDALNNSFMKWKGKLEQIDDVCIIGLRI